MARRIAASFVLLLATLLSSCSLLGNPQPSSSPRPAASRPRPSPSPDPQQKDVDAARQAYIASFNEINRLEMAGGAAQLTRTLIDTTSGEYRELVMQLLRQDEKAGLRLTKSGKLLGFSIGPWTARRIRLTACEDFSGSRWVNGDGTVKRNGDGILYRHIATALKGSDGKWRIDKLGGGKVESLETADCNQGGHW